MGSLIIGQVVTAPGLQWTVLPDDSDAGSGPLFWIYVDKEGRWCLSKEGGEAHASFSSRTEAIAFIRNVEGNAAYRLFIETDDGKVVLEQHATLSPRERTEDDAANGMPAAVENPAVEGQATDLSRRLEWAHRLESAGRVSPSRLGVLAHWLREMWS